MSKRMVTDACLIILKYMTGSQRAIHCLESFVAVIYLIRSELQMIYILNSKQTNVEQGEDLKWSGHMVSLSGFKKIIAVGLYVFL